MRCYAAGLIAIVLAAAFAPAARAHDDVSTVLGHVQEDSVTLTGAQEQAMERHTGAVSAAPARAADAAVSTNPHDVGQWGQLMGWPVVGVEVALLPNGKVLAYASVGDAATETFPDQSFTQATLWDPATGKQTRVDEKMGYNIFCSGLAHLVDGRLFIAGGNKDQQLDGIVQTTIFNPATNTWSRGPNMAGGRWYPTVTPLRNGEMLITSGRVDTPEVRELDGSLRELKTAALGLPLYPWMDVAPDGKVFDSGPDPTLRQLDPTGTGNWQTVGDRGDAITRDYGGHALFDIGKILVAGGGPSTPDARVIDINTPTPQVTPTEPMAFGRRQNNLTVLADGSVLATGGYSSGAVGGLVDLTHSVFNAEQWNPAAGLWRTLAAEQRPRQYHSTALLLPDGRVLSAGGGLCGTCDAVGYLNKDAQVFSPPYLFQADGALAPRPAITSAPASTLYGAALRISTAQAASIRKVALIRLGAVTHSNNMEQRYVPLAFKASAGALTAIAPKNANIAPPGVYMLFIVNPGGVPSVARMVSVGTSAPAAPVQPKPVSGPAAAPTTAPRQTCHPKLSAPRRGRAGSRLVVRFKACRPASVTAWLQRRTPSGYRRTVTRAHERVRHAGHSRLRLSLRHVRPGRYRLRARLGGGHRVTLSRLVVVTRRRPASH
jgi:hypothetical protein